MIVPVDEQMMGPCCIPDIPVVFCFFLAVCYNYTHKIMWKFVCFKERDIETVTAQTQNFLFFGAKNAPKLPSHFMCSPTTFWKPTWCALKIVGCTHETTLSYCQGVRGTRPQISPSLSPFLSPPKKTTPNITHTQTNRNNQTNNCKFDNNMEELLCFRLGWVGW